MTLAKCFFYFFCTCCFHQIKGMSEDYYFGFEDMSLRTSTEQTCLSEQGQRRCEKLCGNSMSLCSGDGTCYCIQSQLRTHNSEIIVATKPERRQRSDYTDNEERKLSEEAFRFVPEQINLRSRSDDNPENNDESQFEELILQSDEYQQPALRHHIAHFCPNLSVAKQCIRTCMKMGKPAFCGKDHVCYCGHRYSSHDISVEKDPKKVYGEFQDIYKKYFGPNINSEEVISLEKDTESLT